jgi:hypothetical protein
MFLKSFHPASDIMEAGRGRGQSHNNSRVILKVLVNFCLVLSEFSRFRVNSKHAVLITKAFDILAKIVNENKIQA